MRRLLTLLSVAVIALVCRADARQTSKPSVAIPTVIPATSDKQDWLGRARATADSGKKARAVIFDDRFATDSQVLFHIAQAFETAYHEKKTPQRLACFAYAAENARMFAYYRGDEANQLEQRAMEALLQFPTGAEKGQDLQYFDVGPHFFLTSDNTIPEAWMAYGLYFAGHLDSKRAAEAFRHAIKLDPHFGEAWYALANLEFEPYSGPVPTAHIPVILKLLVRAEKEEPRMHYFTAGLRCTIAAQGDEVTELRLLKEMVSLTPYTYGAKGQRRIIADLEKKHLGH